MLVISTGACSVYDKSLDSGSGGAGGSDPRTTGSETSGSRGGGGADIGTGAGGVASGTSGGGSPTGAGGATGAGASSASGGSAGSSSGSSGKAGTGGAAMTGGAAGSASGGSTGSGGKSGTGGSASNGGSAGTTSGFPDAGSNDAARDAGVAREAGPLCAPGACKRVFVSSAAPAPSGKLGGVTAADTFCQSAADAVRLGGTWKAWLSDTSGSPSTRFTQAAVPYRLLDGSTIASNWTSLTSGTLAHSINVYEDSTPVAAGVTLEVWTGTTAAGTYSGNACANWTNDTAIAPNADIGLSNQTGAAWTDIYMQFCNRTSIHVYCFEQ